MTVIRWLWRQSSPLLAKVNLVRRCEIAGVENDLCEPKKVETADSLCLVRAQTLCDILCQTGVLRSDSDAYLG